MILIQHIIMNKNCLNIVNIYLIPGLTNFKLNIVLRTVVPAQVTPSALDNRSPSRRHVRRRQGFTLHRGNCRVGSLSLETFRNIVFTMLSDSARNGCVLCSRKGIFYTSYFRLTTARFLYKFFLISEGKLFLNFVQLLRDKVLYLISVNIS